MTLDTRLIGTAAGLPDINLRDHERHSILSGSFIAPNDNEIVVELQMTGVDADDAMRGFQDIARMLTAATRLANTGSADWVQLREQTHQSRAVFWGIAGGSIQPTETHVGMRRFTATLTLQLMDPRPYGNRSFTTTSATLTNGNAAFLLKQTGGDEPALPRIVLTRQGATAIPGYRIGIRPVPGGAALTDWTPFIDLIAAGGTSQADVNAVGGSRIDRALASRVAWSPIAGASQGADALAGGRFHTYLRFADVTTTPTVAMASPLVGTVTDRALVSGTEARTWTAPVIRQSVSANDTAILDTATGRTLSLLWDMVTLDGSYWVAFVGAARNVDGLKLTSVTAPSGWTMIGITKTAPGAVGDEQLYLRVYTRRAAPSNVSELAIPIEWTFNHGTDTGINRWLASVTMFEITGTGADPLDVIDVHPTGATPLVMPSFGMSETTLNPAELILIAFLSYETNAAQYSEWMRGFGEVEEAAPLAVASYTAKPDETGSFSARAINTTASAFTAAAVSIIGTSVLNTSAAVLDSEVPGNLTMGTFLAVVQAQDVYGNLSAPTAIASRTIARDGGRIDYTWTGSADVYVFSWKLNGQVRQRTVYGEAFTLTDMTQGAAITALPTTSKITTYPNRYRLRVGTSVAQYGGDYSFSAARGATPDSVYAGTYDFPPTPERMDGVRPAWGVTVDGSGIGTGRIDALSLFSAEPGASLAHVSSLDNVDNVFVYELRPDGVVVAWVENAAGTLRYPASAVGNLLIPPGDSIMTIEALTGVLSMQFTVAVSYLPRYRWLAGGG